MKELTLLANKYKSDKGTEHGAKHSFSEFYDDHLNHLRENKLNLLEIGVDNGFSLKMWEEYFKNSNILGLDVDDKSYLNTDRIFCKKLDQSNQQDLDNFVLNCSTKFDIIIDDGSHHMLDQQITFGSLFPLLNSGGIFIIEDLHTSLLNNGLYMYGKPIEISYTRDNTTLYFLQNIIKGSKYLTKEKNDYLYNNIKDIKIHQIPNNHSFGTVSITSIVFKI